MLFRHTAEADLWSVVHLTWTSEEEPPGWPAVEFTGTFAEFREAYASPPATTESVLHRPLRHGAQPLFELLLVESTHCR